MPEARMNISIDEDTAERIRQFAWENHSSVSKAISDPVWPAKVKNSEICRQMSLEGVFAGSSRKKAWPSQKGALGRRAPFPYGFRKGGPCKRRRWRTITARAPNVDSQ